jgi:hypothetical protein
MTAYPRYIHRTLNVSASEYEKRLSSTLLAILSRKTHDLAGILAALNASEVRLPSGQAWTEESFSAEMERLGAYPNSVGTSIGNHPQGIVPVGTSTAERPKKQARGGETDAR